MPTVPSGSTAALDSPQGGEELSTPRAPALEERTSGNPFGETGADHEGEQGTFPEQSSPPADSGARLPAARAATGSETNLRALLALVEQATAGVSGARAAGEHLAHELEVLRSILSEKLVSSEQRVLALSRECERLRLEASDVRVDAKRQRDFWMEEQDRFLSGVLEDHEQLVNELRRERDEARSRLERLSGRPASLGPKAPSSGDPEHTAALTLLNEQLEEAMRTIGKLRAECDRSRDVVRRLQSQRDDAQQQVLVLVGERDKAYRELLALHAERMAQRHTIPETRGPSAPPEGASAPAENVSARRTDPMPAFVPAPIPPIAPNRPTFPAPPSESQLAFARLSEPGIIGADVLEAVRSAEVFPSRNRPAGASDPPDADKSLDENESDEAKPAFDALDPIIETHYPSVKPAPLKQKPDPTATPLGSYSLNSEELKQDRVDAEPESSKPPRR